MSLFWALCVAAILVFPPYGQPSSNSRSSAAAAAATTTKAAQNTFQCWRLLLLLARATLSFYSLSLWLRLTSFIFRFMFVQDNNNNKKCTNFLSALFTHTHIHLERESERDMCEAARAHWLALRMRSLCSFSFARDRPTARHIFLFPLCATLPLRCCWSAWQWVWVYVCVCVCMILYVHLYVRALQTRLHFHFSYFRPVFASHTPIDRDTDTRMPTLLCRFYNLSLMYVYVCAHAMFDMFVAMLPNFTHTHRRKRSPQRTLQASHWTFCRRRRAAWKFHLFTFYAHVQNNKSTIITSNNNNETEHAQKAEKLLRNKCKKKEKIMKKPKKNIRKHG